MSDIALYNTLRKISDVSDDEAKEAVSDVASLKEIATKADLKAEISRVDKTIAELNGKVSTMQWTIGLLFIMNVAILAKLFF